MGSNSSPALCVVESRLRARGWALPGDDASGGILHVQRVAELLPGGPQRLPELVHLQHEGVPLVLEQVEHARDAGCR